MVDYKVNTASAKELAALMKSRDEDFSPQLSTRLDIDEYGEKLKTCAVNFEAWDGNMLVGIVSAYINNCDIMQAYIPMVCIDKSFSGRGIARRLMHEFINYANEKGFFESKLEVDKDNESAIALYKSLDYKVESQDNDSVFMIRKVRDI